MQPVTPVEVRVYLTLWLLRPHLEAAPHPLQNQECICLSSSSFEQIFRISGSLNNDLATVNRHAVYKMLGHLGISVLRILDPQLEPYNTRGATCVPVDL